MADEQQTSSGWAMLGMAFAVAAAVGWFALSHVVMHTPAADAVGEALGVALALLIVVSVIGAVHGRDRNGHPDRPRGTGPHP